MDLYYVNDTARDAGTYWVHKLGCEHLPPTYIYLGPFSDCQEALEKARKYYSRVDACPACCAVQANRVFFNPR